MGMGQVRFDRQPPVAVLTLDNAPLNCITGAMFAQLGEHIRQIDRDREIRVVMIRGAGEQHFTAGADVREMAQAALTCTGEARGPFIREWLAGVQSVFTAIERSPKVFICAMKGLAYGGGVEMAAACDIRVAAADARFALPEVKIGIMPGYGGTQRVARLMGKGRALTFILCAEPMDAVTAQGAGLVDVLTDTGAAEATALAMAERLSGYAPLAMAGVKQAIHAGAHLSLDTALQVEAELFAQVALSADTVEGVTAFVQKRKPVFVGE
jgi:enoyl-CoA hydratase